MTSLLLYQLAATERAINDIQAYLRPNLAESRHVEWLFRRESVSTIGSSCYF